MASADLSMRPMTSSSPWPRARWASTPTSRLIACNGWRRSWLAEARKRVLATLACSRAWVLTVSSPTSRLFSKASSMARMKLRWNVRPNPISAHINAPKPAAMPQSMAPPWSA